MPILQWIFNYTSSRKRRITIVPRYDLKKLMKQHAQYVALLAAKSKTIFIVALKKAKSNFFKLKRNQHAFFVPMLYRRPCRKFLGPKAAGIVQPSCDTSQPPIPFPRQLFFLPWGFKTTHGAASMDQKKARHHRLSPWSTQVAPCKLSLENLPFTPHLKVEYIDRPFLNMYWSVLSNLSGPNIVAMGASWGPLLSPDHSDWIWGTTGSDWSPDH